MEVSKIFNVKRLKIALLLVLFISLYSCGTYQSVYNDDGIYASDNQKEVVVIQKKSDFDQNYFSKQLEELESLNDEDTFTNIDDYFYEDDLDNSDDSAPWEYTDDVTININTGGYYGYYGFDYYLSLIHI